VLVVIVAVIWIASSDSWRRRMKFPLLFLLLVGCGLTVAGARLGGESVYRFGTGVGREAPTTLPRTIEYFFPPEQIHIILAGITVAIALAALALSIRSITQAAPVTQVDFIAAALGPPPTLEYSQQMTEPEDVVMSRVPAARFWLLAALAALITIGVGVWLLASGAETWVVKDLIAFVREAPRRLFHVAAGSAILILSLILAALARWAPQQKGLLTIFVILLLAAVAVQVWLGILLLYDTPQGSLMRFN
jgi:hypothetical protein